jgi:hypothetical protein
MRGLQSVGAQSFGGRFALLIGFRLLPCFFQSLHEESTVFGIFGFAFGGFAKSGCGGWEITGLHREEAKVKGIVVFIGIQIGGATEIRLRFGNLVATRAGNGEIVQNFRKVGTGCAGLPLALGSTAAEGLL